MSNYAIYFISITPSFNMVHDKEINVTDQNILINCTHRLGDSRFMQDHLSTFHCIFGQNGEKKNYQNQNFETQDYRSKDKLSST